jgi:RNA polymerase subunit RPABC4/transcription elongation factor Spt4
MPNRTIYLTEEALAKATESGEGVGPYINRLILQGDSCPKDDIQQNVANTSVVIENEKIFTAKEYPLDPPKKKALKPIKVVVPQNGGIVKITGKGDGLHTCKTCGYMLPFYKGKCKNGCK